MPCEPFLAQLKNIDKSLAGIKQSMEGLRDLGFGAGNPIYDNLSALSGEINKLRGQLLGQWKAGATLPRLNLQAGTITGLSPGLVRVWWDIETGWYAEAREEPKASPILQPLTQEQALNLMSAHPDTELLHSLMQLRAPIDN